MNLANEGFEARKKEEEVTAKKRKAEEDARWEGNVLCSVPVPPLLLTSNREQGTASGQLAKLRQYLEKEEEAEGSCSWLKSHSVSILRDVCTRPYRVRVTND
jgi:hypothetical protein